MKINSYKTNFSLIIFCLFLTFSCKNLENSPNKKEVENKLLKDSLYARKWLEVHFGNNRIEEVEIYISKNNDTISNQFKPLKNEHIDTLNSEFYDLNLSKSEKKNVYKGEITIHSKYDKLMLDKKNRKTLEFHYWEQNFDSIWMTSIEIKNSDNIKFEFENVIENRLQGMLYLTVSRDSIVNNEKMINLFRLPLLVDNGNITDNVFLEAFKKDSKFNPQKLKMEIEKELPTTSAIIHYGGIFH